MLQTPIATDTATPLGPDRSRDYEHIRRAIAFLSETWTEQPSLDRLAQHLGLSPAHCQKLFKRWCGLSPKEFVQSITVDNARSLLGGSASVLETAYEVGLSGGSRLHDLFVSHEAMTPGDYKRRGEGLEMAYGFHASPFGDALLIATERGVAGLAFVNEDAVHSRAGGAGRHDAALAQGPLRREAGGHGAARQGDLQRRRSGARSSPCGW